MYIDVNKVYFDYRIEDVKAQDFYRANNIIRAAPSLIWSLDKIRL